MHFINVYILLNTYLLERLCVCIYIIYTYTYYLNICIYTLCIYTYITWTFIYEYVYIYICGKGICTNHNRPSFKWRSVFAPRLLLRCQGKCSSSDPDENGYRATWSSLQLILLRCCLEVNTGCLEHVFSHDCSGPLQLLECPQSDCKLSKTAGLPWGQSGQLPVNGSLWTARYSSLPCIRKGPNSC
jgi:hypothetical protein